MKYFLILVMILGFIGCGSDNSEKEIYTKFVYDKNSTQDKISYLFSTGSFPTWNKEVEDIVVPNQESLDRLIERLTDLNDMQSEYDQDTKDRIANQLQSININFEYYNIIILFHSIDCRKDQYFMSLDIENNAKVEIKKFIDSSTRDCPAWIDYSNSIYKISKDIKTINGIDNF